MVLRMRDLPRLRRWCRKGAGRFGPRALVSTSLQAWYILQGLGLATLALPIGHVATLTRSDGTDNPKMSNRLCQDVGTKAGWLRRVSAKQREGLASGCCGRLLPAAAPRQSHWVFTLPIHMVAARCCCAPCAEMETLTRTSTASLFL